MPAVVVTPVGASGAFAGITARVAIDSTEVTELAFAVELVTALNVYSDPFVSPVTVHDPLVKEVVTVQVEPGTAVPVLSYA